MNGKKVIVLVLVVMALGMIYLACDSLRTAFNFTDIKTPEGISRSLLGIITFVLMLLGAVVLLAGAYTVSIRE